MVLGVPTDRFLDRNRGFYTSINRGLWGVLLAPHRPRFMLFFGTAPVNRGLCGCVWHPLTSRFLEMRLAPPINRGLWGYFWHGTAPHKPRFWGCFRLSHKPRFMGCFCRINRGPGYGGTFWHPTHEPRFLYQYKPRFLGVLLARLGTP